MAKIRVTVSIAANWTADTRLRLIVGTENAASLAASTPSGGTIKTELTLGPRAAQATATIEADVTPTDVSATVPIGVQAVDAAGNVSTVLERFAQLADRPTGARSLTISNTDPAAAGKALLAWTASPHVVGDGLNFQSFDFA